MQAGQQDGLSFEFAGVGKVDAVQDSSLEFFDAVKMRTSGSDERACADQKLVEILPLSLVVFGASSYFPLRVYPANADYLGAESDILADSKMVCVEILVFQHLVSGRKVVVMVGEWEIGDGAHESVRENQKVGAGKGANYAPAAVEYSVWSDGYGTIVSGLP